MMGYIYIYIYISLSLYIYIYICIGQAFGEDGELSEKKFPQLKEMRERIRELEASPPSRVWGSPTI